MNLTKCVFNYIAFVLQIFTKRKVEGPMVLLPIKNSMGRYVFYCPGCDTTHIININPHNDLPVHKLLGSLKKPTIRASVLSKGDKSTGKPHCHSLITKGKIKFFMDSSHGLAGKNVSLPAI